MPPDVGIEETSSDIVNPMIRMKTEMIGHDHEIETGPPFAIPAPYVVRQPARIEMIENEMAKFENPDQDRESSCLYPSFASIASSSESFDVSAMAAPSRGSCECEPDARPGLVRVSRAEGELV